MLNLYRSLINAGRSYPVRFVCIASLHGCEILCLTLPAPNSQTHAPVMSQDYNIRDYVVRRVRQDFRKNVGLEGSPLAEALAFVSAALCASSAPSHLANSSLPSHLPAQPCPLRSPHPLPCLPQGTSQLSLINRQAAIAASYPHELSVMEGSGAGGSSSSGSLPSATRASAVAGAAGPAVSGLGAQEAGGEDEEEPMIARPRDMA